MLELQDFQPKMGHFALSVKIFIVVTDCVKDCYHTGGVLAGAIWQQNGFLSELGRQFPALTYITDYYSNLGHGGYNGWSSPWPVAPRR